MEGHRTKAAYSETDVTDDTQGNAQTNNSGAWKACHGSPHAITKGGGNKVRSYNSTYAPRSEKNTTPQKKNETPTVMVHAGNINKTTTLPLPIEEEWRQDTSEYHDLGYIKIIYLFQRRHLLNLKVISNTFSKYVWSWTMV